MTWIASDGQGNRGQANAGGSDYNDAESHFKQQVHMTSDAPTSLDMFLHAFYAPLP